jgi:UDP-N-acetylmuramate--alanine ligase
VPLVHDYAHHPTEVRVTIEAARRVYPNKKIHVLFQPHQASRTARLMDEFVEALRTVERVVVADVYGARKHVDRVEGADAETLVTRLLRAGKDAATGGPPRAACQEFVNGLVEGACGLVLGAGDIDSIKEELIDAVAVRFGSER